MKKLEEVIRVADGTLFLIERQGNIAIYKRTCKQSGFVCYEVIKIQTRKEPQGNALKSYLASLEKGTISEYPREVYPTTTQWGVFAYTYRDLESAKERFNNFNRKIKSCRV